MNLYGVPHPFPERFSFFFVFFLFLSGPHTTHFLTDTSEILNNNPKGPAEAPSCLMIPSRICVCNLEYAMFILLDLNTNLYLVQDGTVAPILKTPILSSMIPPIEPYIKDLKFRFNATGMVWMTHKLKRNI